MGGSAALACCFSALCLAAEAQPSPPTTTVVEQHGQLACGTARFEAVTQYLEVPDHDRQVQAQRLSLIGEAPGSSHSLPHEGRLLRQPFLRQTPVLDAWVSGWACVASADGRHQYLYLMYVCAESPLRPACAGDTREWVRLLDTRGRPLNGGFPHAGPRTPALMKRLGLGRHLQEGVTLKDIAD